MSVGEVLQTILARFCLFIKFLPLLGLILLIAIIDGLVQRDIRKFKGARESMFLFHQFRFMAGITFIALFAIFMIMPHVRPEIIMIPGIFILGLLLMHCIKNFRKYL